MDLTRKCPMCSRNVQANGIHIKCKNCLHLNHINCVQISREDMPTMQDWFCPKCIQSIIPFNHFHDDDDFRNAIKEISLDCTWRQHTIDNLYFDPFTLNESTKTPLYDTDPDIQFYLDTQYIRNSDCDYFIEDTFNKYVDKVPKDCKEMFSLVHLNIRSLPKHNDEFSNYINLLEHRFKFIGLTETWLNEYNTELYGFDGYTGKHRHRKNRNGGGVSIYVEENIKYKERVDLEHFDENLETVFIEIDKEELGTKKNTIIGVIYRIPGTSPEDFNTKIAQTLSKISLENKSCYLMGDFNMDLLKFDTHTETSNLLDLIYSNGFIPVICKPTRITTETESLIDHIYTNEIHNDQRFKKKQGILRTDISDHCPVFYISYKESVVKNDKGNSYIGRKIDPTTIAVFCNEMNIIDWEIVTCQNDVQSAFSSFHNKIRETYNKSFPKKRYKRSYHDKKPWLTSALKESIKIKNKLYIKLTNKLANKDSTYRYKQYKNKLNHLLRIAEKNHYGDQLLKHKSNMRKTWEIIKTVVNKKRNYTNNTSFVINKRRTDDKKTISDGFNKYFINVGPTLAKLIPNNNKPAMTYVSQNIVETFYITPTTEGEIEKIISNFKDTAAGWDNLSPNIIKQIRQSIVSPLVHICNISFSYGIFPDELKIAKVIPIFKHGDVELFQNYRPVSVLPSISKIYERLMYNRLILFLEKHKILCELQFGFREGRSPFMALTEAIDLITNALDKGNTIVGVFLDLSKAFDTVNHDILLNKLQKYGVRGVALKWFQSYLSNRKQFVSYNGVTSDEEHIKFGVPQGSILGPLLFLLYINDLSTVSNHFRLILFADDANLFFEKKESMGMDTYINDELGKVQEWMDCNGLTLNLKKTQYMIYTSMGRNASDIDIKLKQTQIERVYKTKFLGIMIDAKLTWTPHIESISKKLSKSIGIILKARKKLDSKVLNTLYYSFFYPYLNYCNQIWGKTYITNLKPLYLLQKKIVRIISGSSYLAHTEPLMKEHKILNIDSINVYSRAIFMYNFTRGCLPGIFQNYFDYNRDYHAYNTRHKNNLHQSSYKLDVRKFAIRSSGTVLWNSLHNEIRDAPTVHIFKRRLRSHLIHSQTNTF